MNKPNLFAIATSELSQDAFFAWLISWADQKYASVDTWLHALAQDFVKALVPDYVAEIKHVKAIRQRHRIDMLIEINDDLVIVIEDKVGAKQHGNQLQRYKDIVQQSNDYVKKQKIFVYLKTLNESDYTLKQVERLNYKVFSRPEILAVLNAHSNVTHGVLVEFKNYLQSIQDQTVGPYTLDSISSSWRNAEGFYGVIESRLKAELNLKHHEVGWQYVQNPTGGFLCLWGLHSKCGDLKAYVQIENPIKRQPLDIRVVVKTRGYGTKVSTGQLYPLLDKLRVVCITFGVSLVKPSKLTGGETSTVAVLQNPFKTNEQGEIDIDAFVQTLITLGKVIEAAGELPNLAV